MIPKISTMLAQLRPAWLKTPETVSRPPLRPTDWQKILGEPLPKVIDPAALPPELAALFAAYGLLNRVRRKLETISRRKGNAVIPASGTIACVDAEGNIYVGVEFLAQHHADEGLIAGILAHEWGHMLSEISPDENLSHLKWDDVFEVRRGEERGADAFAGRTLYRLGYSPDSMIRFLTELEKNKKFKSVKYDSAETRAAIIKEAFLAELRKTELTRKLFDEKDGYKNPNASILIATA